MQSFTVATEALSAEGPELRAVLEVRLMLNQALADYPAIRRRDDAADAWQWLERLAERWRRNAELTGFETVGGQFIPEEGAGLYASLEGSLALIGRGDPRRHELEISDDEQFERLVPVGAELWSSAWDRSCDEAWREQLRRAGRPDYADRPPDWPPVPPPFRFQRKSKREMRPLLEVVHGQPAPRRRHLGAGGRRAAGVRGRQRGRRRTMIPVLKAAR